MTSKLKCPICGGDIQYNDGYSTYDCKNNPANHNASEEIWKALIQAKQDLEQSEKCCSAWEIRALDYKAETIALSVKLEIARKALEEMQHWLGVVRCSMISHLNNQNNTLLEHYETDPTVQNIDKAKRVLKQYLEQIEHKE